MIFILSKIIVTQFRGILLGVIFLLFSPLISAQITQTSESAGNWNDVSWDPAGNPDSTDVRINNKVITIPIGDTVTVNDLEITQNGHLKVEGTLKVLGNLTMANNGSEFSMGNKAYVVIDGNFESQNKISISVSSYLIIRGSFTTKGDDDKSELDVNDGNIYIFGDVENWDELDHCGEYEGGTNNPGDEKCDYGNEEDFEDNQETFPDELIDLVNCYDLSTIDHEEVCAGGTAVFQVGYLEEVNYQWQQKVAGEESWNPIGEDSNVLEINNVDISFTGNSYRVKATPKDGEVSNCSSSISRVVNLTVKDQVHWTGEENVAWENPNNWSCGSVPNLEINVLIPENVLRFPVVSFGTLGAAKNIELETNASLLVEGNLEVSGAVLANGNIDSRNGSIWMKGTSSQSISGSVFLMETIENLVIQNSSGVSLLANLSVIGSVLADEGNLNSNGFLTLVSDENGTAFIDGSGQGEIDGMVTMQRYLDPAFGYKYISSPFQETTVGDFASYVDLEASFPNFYAYDENREQEVIVDGNKIMTDASGWINYTEPNNVLYVMQGYAANFGDTEGVKTISISGKVNNIPLEIELANHGGNHTKGFNLVGNPYPSPIDWKSDAGWTKDNIDDAIYFFTASDPSRSEVDGLASYRGTYTSYVDGISSDGRATSIIPSMQGFFVRVSNPDPADGILPVNGTLGMNNLVRVTDKQEFYKSLENKTPLIRLGAALGGEEKVDPAVVYFHREASISFDKDLDALKMMNTDGNVPNLYSISSDNNELSINAAPFSEEEVIRFPLGIRTERSGRMKVQLLDIENFPANYHIYLIDRQQRMAQDLRRNPEYSFNIETGTLDSRFELLLSTTPLEEEAVAFQEPFSVRVVDSNVLLVKLNLEPHQSAVVRVYSIFGQLLEMKRGRAKELLEMRGVNTNGVHIVTVEVGGKRHSKKILIN